MGLKIIILSEVRDKYHMISLTCGILTHDANELNYEKDSQTERRDYACQVGGWIGSLQMQTVIYRLNK